jgi:hypothetical protein
VSGFHVSSVADPAAAVAMVRVASRHALRALDIIMPCVGCDSPVPSPVSTQRVVSHTAFRGPW